MQKVMQAGNCREQVQNTHWAYNDSNSLVIKLLDKIRKICLYDSPQFHTWIFKSDLTTIQILLTPWLNNKQIQRWNRTDGKRKNTLSDKCYIK